MPKSIFLFIPAIFIVLLLAAISSKYQPVPKSSPVVISPTPVPETIWQTYQDKNISFSYPSTFEKAAGGYTPKFNDSQNGFSLSFFSEDNYNQVTGKTYPSVDDYIGMPYKVKEVIVDGQSGRQPLPRAGSENVFSAVLFSKDSSKIYTLELKAGDAPFNTPPETIIEGQSVFNQILSTIKFIDSAPVLTQKVQIKNITKRNSSDYLIDLDFVEWVNDQNAPDGYRIVNTNSLIRTLKLNSGSRINLLNSDYTALVSVPIGDFYDQYKTRPFPNYEVKYQGDTISSLREIYTP